MDNPTYEEGMSLASIPATDSQGGECQNLAYSDVGPHPQSNAVKLSCAEYEVPYSEAAAVSETVYENTNKIAESAFIDKEGATSGGVMEGNMSETVYNVPQHMESLQDEDDGCYSALGPTDYAILEPHIANPTHHQLPPPDEDYSHLQH